MNWYRSLYSRIALGFVVFLAAMLVVQAVLFVWVIAQTDRAIPGGSAERFAQGVALDLSNELERDPRINIDTYIHEQYSSSSYPFTVVLDNGPAIAVGASAPSEAALRGIRAAMRRDRLPYGRSGRSCSQGWERPRRSLDPDTAPPSASKPEAGTGLSGARAYRLPRPAQAVVANGELIGGVIAPQRPPYSFLIIRFAPLLSSVAAGVLIVGAALTSILVFGPPRRRLRALETAARQIGAGDLSARAPDRGGDEISAVARAFNAMAGDLSARADALAASDRVRRQLLADVSHELNTPVTAMRGYLETLTMSDMPIDEATRVRYLGIVSDETSRLERIIGDLLDLARLEGGGGKWTMEHVPVAQIFERVAARHERACREGDVTLLASIERGAEEVTGDRDRLEQALQNLASNGLRYAPRDSTIVLSARPVAEGVTISVADAGPGIPSEHLPHIFDRFYKADASRASGGSGLSIVKAIVERHGGRVAVSSQPGRTTFELTIRN